jgi:putative ABC transport system permease protein
MQKQMQTLRLAYKLFYKELRQGQLNLLFLSIVIAVGSLTCIGFLIQRIDHSMLDHASQLNAAKLILKSSSQVPPQWLDRARKLHLQQAEMQVFSSMLVVNEQFKLAQVKAVSDNFPLQGELLVRKTMDDFPEVKTAPEKGNMWLDRRLAQFFKQEGVTGPISLGEAEFHTNGILERVPGQSSSAFTIAPTVMINLTDLSKTATVQPGSRVDYIYFFSSSEVHNNLAAFRQWLQPQLLAGQSLRSGVEGLKAVNSNLKKAGDFLSLAALLTVLLASIAIAINSFRYGQKQYKNSAIMLCLGCSEKRILSIELFKLFLLGLAGSAVGICCGFVVYSGVLQLMDDVLPAANSLVARGLHPISLSPAWMGLGCGFLLLISLSMANLIRLKKLSPMALIRKDQGQESVSSKLFYLMSLTGLGLISFLYTDNLKVTSWFYLAIIVCSIGLYFLSRLLLERIIQAGRRYHLINRLSLLNLERHRRSVLLQVSTFSLIFALLILIFLVRTELLTKWQQQFPEKTPNHFVINVQSYETQAFKHFLQQEGIQIKGIYPMVRGRLTHLNQKPIKEMIPEAAHKHNALHRELSLSYEQNATIHKKQDLQANHTIVNISIESEMASAFNIKRGDRLGFQIGSQYIEGQVNDLRKVRWDSFQPNFYIIFSPGQIEQYPMTWIASFFLSDAEKYKLTELIERFPGLTIIEVDKIIKEVQFIIAKISHAIEFIFFFILAAGLLILSSSLSATLADRMYENAVIRTLGASARQLRRCLVIEFSVVALLSAFIAIIMAELASFILYQQIFNMTYAPHPLVWLGTVSISFVLICGMGLIVVNKIFTQSSFVSLNEFS